MKWYFVCLIILAVLLLLWLAAGAFFHYVTTKRGGQNHFCRRAKEQNKLPFPFDRSWLERANAQDVYLQSFDGLRLHSYVIDQGHKDWVMICHPYTANAKCVAPFGEKMAAEGFNVILPDARAHGKSQGPYRGMGWLDRRDMVDWLKLIKENYEEDRIVLYGISMGGAIVMMTCGEEDLPEEVCALIDDSGYSSVLEELKFMLNGFYRLPAEPILAAANIFFRIHQGFSFYKEGFAQRQLPKFYKPCLMMHCDQDNYVPFPMLDIVYRAANEPKEKMVVEGATHAKTSVKEPERYWNTVWSFLDRYCPNRDKPQQ